MNAKSILILFSYSYFCTASNQKQNNIFDLTEANTIKEFSFDENASIIIEKKLFEISSTIDRYKSPCHKPSWTTDLDNDLILFKLRDYQRNIITEEHVKIILNILDLQIPGVEIISLFEFIFDNCRIKVDCLEIFRAKIERMHLLYKKLYDLRNKFKDHLYIVTEYNSNVLEMIKICLGEYDFIKTLIEKILFSLHGEGKLILDDIAEAWYSLTPWEKYWASCSDFFEENDKTKMNLISVFCKTCIEEKLNQKQKFKNDINHVSSVYFITLAMKKQLEAKIAIYFYHGKKLYFLREKGKKFLKKCKEYFGTHWKNDQKTFMNNCYECENALQEELRIFYESEVINLNSPIDFIKSMADDFTVDSIIFFVKNLSRESSSFKLSLTFIKESITKNFDQISFLNKESINDISLHLNDIEYLRKKYSNFILKHIELTIHLNLISCKIVYNFLIDNCNALLEVLFEKEFENSHENELVFKNIVKLNQIKKDLEDDFIKYCGVYANFKVN